MIDKERLLTLMKEEATRPLSESELIEQLQLESVEEMVTLKSLLKKLENEGALVLTRKNRYGLPEQLNLFVGRLIRHPKGFGFLAIDGVDEDLYINSNDLHGAMHNDRVIARVKRPAVVDKRTGATYRAEGEVIRILVRNTERVLGTFEKSHYFGFVTPDDKRFGSDIFISKDDMMDAQSGMKVMVEITRWPENNRSAEGKIVEVIGVKGDPGIDVISVVYKHNLPQNFPQNVQNAAQEVPESVLSYELTGRRDLRNLPMITIDGDDAKDLDDAVTLEKLENGLYRLGVHIADVGHYVPAESILDQEALKRATSIYLVDRVIPMLPQRLSNGICSLNAGVDRLAMTCFMDIDHKGVVVNHKICESVIHVDYRMTYKDVNKIIVDEDKSLREQYHSIVPMLEEMAKLQSILQKKRMRRGAIEFDVPESKVFLDENGKPLRIEWRERLLADQIIEEFMLCANETVAEHYFWLDVPFLYRVHEEPKSENLLDVNKFLQVFGYHLKGVGGAMHPKAYQSIVEAVRGEKEEKTINTILLRSMQHARYSTEALGHFGLAAKYYAHFTSPIRRYPDLAIHRVIKECLHHGEKLSAERNHYWANKMSEYAEISSMREKIAEEAERESVDMKKVEYMLPFEGEIFNGVISGVTNFGFFVQLENSVEGLVHISSLIDDFYQFEPTTYTLLGEHTRNQYQLGQEVTVRLVKVNVDERQLDFEIIRKNKKKKNNTNASSNQKNRIETKKRVHPKDHKKSNKSKKKMKKRHIDNNRW